MTEVSVELDENNRDVLYARRGEIFFEPNEDGSPSTRGKIVWHTEWWHYSGSIRRGVSLGPRIERQVSDILSDEYGGLPAPVIIAALKDAYVAHARQDTGIGAEPEPDPEPDPED